MSECVLGGFVIYVMSSLTLCLGTLCPVGEASRGEESEVCHPVDELLGEQDEMLDCTLPVPNVQGNVRKHSDFWLKQLEPSSFVRNIVLHGYRLPFLSLPAPIVRNNHNSALVEEGFVESEIERLLEASCIVESHVCPTVCSPLSVVANSRGKKRLVIDLRSINELLPKQKFKYEGLNLIPHICSQGDYFFSFDLKSGYHHVDIHPDCWTYLGFSWAMSGGQRRFFMFRVLPFGLSTACYVFRKFLRPLVKYWRSSGLRVILYIDDGIGIASSVDECRAVCGRVLSDLESAGLVLKHDKSRLDPQQQGLWLGFSLDLDRGLFTVPMEKVSKLKEAIAAVSQAVRVPVRLLASVVGQIISMGLAVGPITRLRTRYMYEAINLRWSCSLV